jgi:hypothetical protein
VPIFAVGHDLIGSTQGAGRALLFVRCGAADAMNDVGEHARDLLA